MALHKLFLDYTLPYHTKVKLKVKNTFLERHKI